MVANENAVAATDGVTPLNVTRQKARGMVMSGSDGERVMVDGARFDPGPHQIDGTACGMTGSGSRSRDGATADAAATGSIR